MFFLRICTLSPRTLHPEEAEKHVKLCIQEFYFSLGAGQGSLTRISRFSCPASNELQLDTGVIPGDVSSTLFRSGLAKRQVVVATIRADVFHCTYSLRILNNSQAPLLEWPHFLIITCQRESAFLQDRNLLDCTPSETKRRLGTRF
jgi:hypothetical protein